MFSKNNDDIICVAQPEQLFKKLYPRLCDFANYILKDKELAEDMAQDAFIVYLEQQNKISSDFNAVKPFLYTAVKNACLNKIRHNNVVDIYNKKNPLDIYTDTKILEGIIHAEVIAEIYEKINALPQGCAMVIRYGYLEGLSNGEIAELMNISINTVKSQKKRALMLLKTHLGKAAMMLFILMYVNK
ncbi:MAG: RNA polymerase sigma-70 factor [Bacteroidota bacterium]